jgi:hypothetical protein
VTVQINRGTRRVSSHRKAGEPRLASASEFKGAFDRAFAGSPRAWYVSHYSEEELAKMKTFLSHDGKTGVAVHDHGDGRVEVTALFNQGGPPGARIAMLQHAVDHAGANYVECFGEPLRNAYSMLGFTETSRSAFDPKYAPPHWTPGSGTPDYFTMSLSRRK